MTSNCHTQIMIKLKLDLVSLKEKPEHIIQKLEGSQWSVYLWLNFVLLETYKQSTIVCFVQTVRVHNITENSKAYGANTAGKVLV